MFSTDDSTFLELNEFQKNSTLNINDLVCVRATC